MLLYDPSNPEPEPSPYHYERVCPQHGDVLTACINDWRRIRSDTPERLICPQGHDINPAEGIFWVWDTKAERRVAVVSRGTVRWEEWFFTAARQLAGRDATGAVPGMEVEEPGPFLSSKRMRAEVMLRKLERSKRVLARRAAVLERRMLVLTRIH
jgi:hypothetical protein